MQILSKVLAANTALIRPITPRLSIYENFSLGFLWKAKHKKPGETGKGENEHE